MEGRKLVISGAGRGLGRALAIVAASQGATPILLGRSQSALQEVSETIKSDSGATAYPIVCDLSDPTSVAQATEEIAESHPDIDILVNNGAHFTEGSFDKQTDDQIAAAKAAQDGFTQGLLEEMKGTSVRVTSVYPGLIEDVSPTSVEWQKQRSSDEGITNKNVVDTIIYALSAPPNVSLRSIVIERTHSDFLI
ncbi:hypothetical protein ACKAV7_014501 [Fusarium commune]